MSIGKERIILILLLTSSFLLFIALVLSNANGLRVAEEFQKMGAAKIVNNENQALEPEVSNRGR
jgi:hypothetical protein